MTDSERTRAPDAAWKQRFRARAVTWTAIAGRAPERGLAVGNLTSEVIQLHAWDVPTGRLSPVTEASTGIFFGVLAPDGRHIHYFRDQGGNETGHYVRVPFEGGEPEDLTPGMPPYASLPGMSAISGDGRRFCFAMADRSGFRAYCIDLSGPDGNHPNQPRKVFESPGLTDLAAVSAEGAVAALASSERSARPQYSLFAVDLDTGERLRELWDGPGTSIEGGPFSPFEGDQRLAAVSDRTGYKRPFIWDASSGERRDLSADDIPGDLIPMGWSPDGRELVLLQVHRARHGLVVHDLERGTATKLECPDGSFFRLLPMGIYFTPRGEIFASWQDSTKPSRLVALDRHTGHVNRTVLAPRPEPPAGRRWRSVAFPSSEGQEIQGWLATPGGDGPFPTILETHGGPQAVTTEVFWPFGQAWLDNGFAWLSINYRGSTTFGRDFEESIWGEIGRWELDDMVAARDWLVQEGIADPDRILLTGGSYGGYLTLWGLVRRPDLWAGGMALIAVADWKAMYEESSPVLRAYERALFGGSPDEVPERYEASSPITYVENLGAPLLVINGRNDTRCPPGQMEAFIDRARRLGKAVEIEWFDAGHGLTAQVDQSVRDQELMLDFARRLVALAPA
jgi:dienelactone hydrolase